MIVKIVALLGILAACSQGVQIDTVYFIGRISGKDGYYILNDETRQNTFEVLVTAEKADFGKTFTVGIYKSDEEPVVEPQQFKPTQEGSRWITLVLKSLEVKKRVSYVRLEARAIKTEPTTVVTKLYDLYILDVKEFSVPTYQVEISPYPACSSSLLITSPFTYPPLRAKCGVWLDDYTDPRKSAFANNTDLVFNSVTSNEWKQAQDRDSKIQLVLYVPEFNLKPIGDEEDQSDKDKYIKCEFSYYYLDKKRFSPYISDVVKHIKLETTGDLCGPNPFDKLWNDEHNKHVIPTNQEKGASCYLKDDELPNILSNYKCEEIDAEEHTISTFCEHEKYEWKYDIDQGSLRPWNETDGLSFITGCLDRSRTLRVDQVSFSGPYENFAVASEPDQRVSCSFSVNETEVPENVTATVIIRNDHQLLSSETVLVERGEEEVIHVKGEEHTLQLNFTYLQLNLTCEVKLGDYNRGVVGEENLIPVIQVHPESDYTRIHVDSEKCQLNIRKLSRSYTRPPLFAFCGVWTANSTENFQHGEWLQGEGVTFNSTNGDWSNHTWKYDEEYLQYYLENKTIPISNMSSEEINWLRCKFDVLDSDGVPVGTFSEVIERVVPYNMADECDVNPLELIDIEKYRAKLIYNEEVSSCFGDKGKIHPSVTAKCRDSSSFYSVNCKDKEYVINDGEKEQKYNEEEMKKMLKDGCTPEPKTLKVHQVMFKGPYEHFAVTSEREQSVSCSFSVSASEVPEPRNATWYIALNGSYIFSDTVLLEKKEGEDIIEVQGADNILDDILLENYDLDLRCIVTFSEHSQPFKGDNIIIPIIAVHPEPDYTNIDVDSEECNVKINGISRSYTKPPLFAFCGIWIANSTEDFQNGDWLQSEGASFNSSNGDWSYNAWENDTEFIQYHLSDKTIPIHNMSSQEINWLRCKFEAMDYSGEIIGTFSEVIERVVPYNLADECGMNPLQLIDIQRYEAKLVYSVEVQSCFDGGRKEYPSITAQCTGSSNFYSVNCKNKEFMIYDGKYNMKYDEEKMKQLLKDGCSAGGGTTLPPHPF